jgi:curved DNA-binding protein CbpA
MLEGAAGGSSNSPAPPLDAMTYYAILGVTEDAERETIRSAFRALARQYHPDAGASASAAEFRRILEAYEALNDPERRRAYDESLRRAREQPPVRITVVEPLRAPSRVPRSRINEPLSVAPAFRTRLDRGAIEDELDLLFAAVDEMFFSRFRYR